MVFNTSGAPLTINKYSPLDVLTMQALRDSSGEKSNILRTSTKLALIFEELESVALNYIAWS